MKNIITEIKVIGEGVSISESANIECRELIIGNDVTIDERTKILCKNGRVVIEDQTYIGKDVTIILKSFTIGEYCKLHNHTLINGKESVNIGHNCWIGQNCVLNGEENLLIGNNVGIGTYSSVWTHGFFGQLVDGCKFYTIKPTIIEDDVWLVGSYNTIFPGVTIGKQAVLMGTSVVTKSLEGGRVYGGNPAKDITEKVGLPYSKLSHKENIDIISKHITKYLIQSGIPFSNKGDYIIIDNYGKIIFQNPDKCVNTHEINSVAFYENVTNWDNLPLLTKFCLKTKFYNKNYSPIEIMVRKILNTVVARFIPIK